MIGHQVAHLALAMLVEGIIGIMPEKVGELFASIYKIGGLSFHFTFTSLDWAAKVIKLCD